MIRSALMLLFAGLTLTLGGCAFPGVAWMPDSSGLIFMGKDGKEIHFLDRVSGKTRLLVADSGSTTCWPAIRPDGKQFAVARGEKRKGFPHRIQVILYGFDGKELQRSPWLDTKGKPKQEVGKLPTMLLWGKQEKILVVADSTSLYDTKAQSLTPVENCVLWHLGISGIHPGGKGFLATDSGKASDLYFVEWDLTKHRLQGKMPEVGQDNGIFLLEWQGDVAVFVAGAKVYEADTVKRTLRESTRKLPGLPLPTEGNTWAWYAFPGGSSAIALVADRPRKGSSEEPVRRIEYHDLKGRQKRVIKSECRPIPILFPSPDGKNLALFYEAKGQQKGGFLIVLDAEGIVLREISFEG